jgi:hypothetical protein
MHSGFGSASSSIAMIWFVPSGSGLMYGVKLGCHNYPVKPTFYHHDNKSSSQIDYLFTLKDQIKDGIIAIKITVF